MGRPNIRPVHQVAEHAPAPKHAAHPEAADAAPVLRPDQLGGGLVRQAHHVPPQLDGVRHTLALLTGQGGSRGAGVLAGGDAT